MKMQQQHIYKPGEIDSLMFGLMLDNIPQNQIESLFETVREVFPTKTVKKQRRSEAPHIEQHRAKDVTAKEFHRAAIGEAGTSAV